MVGDVLVGGAGASGETVIVSRHPSRVWQRAAVYGSLWAAVEIVVGSFLHNLRIPFAGMILSAFGVTVMTAGHRAFPERGLIWRAALICALMKSISPSAVILGPMIGIAMEGVLLETSVRLLGGHAVGYLVGGALAVSWTLAQRILNAVIAFGPDVVRLYVETYNFASRSLGVSRFGPFDLIATLVVAEWAFGVAAAGFGLRVGRSAGAAPAAPGRPSSALAFAGGAPIVAEGEWSVRRLALTSAALLVGMVGLALVPVWGGLVYVAGFAAFVLRTYPRAAARIRRPSLWIEMAFVMLLAGALLGGARGGLSGLASGASAGAAMVLRATMVLLGFSAISVELRNPSILSWVERRRLRGLSDALGAAFGALPAFTAALSQRRGEWRHPTRVLTGLVQLANGLVTAPPGRTAARRCVILRGSTGSGKTTLAREVVAHLREGGQAVAGILAPGLWEDGRRTGFDLINLATGESTALARETADVEGPHARWSRFAFSPGGLALGQRALGPDAHGADVVVVDEVGPFELAGGGWARSLDDLARDFHGSLLLVARGTIVEAVLARWGSPDTVVYDVDQGSPDRIASLLSGRESADNSRPAIG
jgi:nucleoside-triphosphatase THEP1